MLNLDRIAGGIAARFSAVAGGPYVAGFVRRSTPPVEDEGGSIVTPGDVIELNCLVQADSITEAMRSADGYTDKDMRLLVLASSLAGEIDTDCTVAVLAGPHGGEWQVAAVNRDPIGIYWECRGRQLAPASPGYFANLSLPENAILVGDLL